MKAVYRVMPEVAPGVFRSRPTGGSPGFEYRLDEWTPPVENPVWCESGYHTVTAGGIVDYVRPGDALIECLHQGQSDIKSNKATNVSVMPATVVGYVTQAMLCHHVADCAESMLHLYTKKYPDDPTLEVIIHTIHAYADGEATDTELRAAVDAAAAADEAAYAEAYATDAARSASYAAACTDYAARSAAYATYEAAYGAANAVAYVAASAAARAAAYAAANASHSEMLGEMLVERVRRG